MSKKASPTVIGIFTLAGLIIAAIGLTLFGADRYFKKTYPILLYFEKSANGLLVGSDVRFGGVRIGRVNSINVLIDREENRKIIPVVVELGEKELSLINTTGGGGIDFSTRDGVARAVKEGLRAGMKQQSLVTGQLYIEFDIVPDSPGFIYQASDGASYPVVPTIGTEMDELISGISDGLKKFNALDLDSVMAELRDVLVSTKNQIDQIEIREINDNITQITRDVRNITSDEKFGSAMENLNQALVEIDEFATKANAGFEPLLTDLKAVIARTDAGVARLEEAAAGISNASNPRAPAMLRINELITETERASRALKELTADLERNPSTLLRGRVTPK
jgi:paraquat-inducible protein B